MDCAKYCIGCIHCEVCKMVELVKDTEKKMYTNAQTSTSPKSAVVINCPYRRSDTVKEPNDFGALKWISPAEGREHTWKKLYLAFQPGYPLMIADWKTGHGYRDVRTGESIDPTQVAYINLPFD